jgi:hypothetical protein
MEQCFLLQQWKVTKTPIESASSSGPHSPAHWNPLGTPGESFFNMFPRIECCSTSLAPGHIDLTKSGSGTRIAPPQYIASNPLKTNGLATPEWITHQLHGALIRPAHGIPKSHYHWSTLQATPFFLTTVINHTSLTDRFYIIASSTPFPTMVPSNNLVAQDAPVPDLLSNTHEFYKCLIRPLKEISESTQLSLAHGIELETLQACSDGSVTSGKGAHGWIFADGANPILQGAGPDDGHPDYMTSYQSELGGLLAVLYLIHRICSHFNIQSGKVHYYCDNKGVLQNIFHKPDKPGITSFMESDSELVEAAHKLVNIIPITIIASWVKGHQPSNKGTQYKLNNIADRLASNFSQYHHSGFQPRKLPTAPPNYRVRLLYRQSVITTKLYPILSASLHSESLQSHIIRKAKWSPSTFHLVNWDAHSRAFQ